MTKSRAFVIHLVASAAIFLFFLGIVFFIWYPAPHFGIDGGWDILKIMAGVDIILGPLLTLIVFKSGKPSLKFDMTCIVLIQVGALIYGSMVIYQQRPAFVVFAVDRFTSIPAADVEFEKLKYPELKRTMGIEPLLAIAELPEDRDEQQKLMFDVVLKGQKDIEFRADLYKPYKPDLKVLQERNIDIPQIMALDATAKQAVDTFLKEKGGDLEDYLFLPLKGRNRDIVMVLSGKDGMPVGWIDSSPWISDYKEKEPKKPSSPAQPATPSKSPSENQSSSNSQAVHSESDKVNDTSTELPESQSSQ